MELEKKLDSFNYKIEALEKEKETSTKLVKELKETITLLETDNVDLKVHNIIQQKIIWAHAPQSESESYPVIDVTLTLTKKTI